MEKNYKDTLLIYQTNFEMKANLKEKEIVFQKEWIENDIYNKKITRNAENPHFILHDGPPYANGDIHVGHALNKILKDFIVRWKNSNGFNAPYIMGWDTHGLPIETAVIKTGINQKKLKATEFRDLCKEYALNQVKNQSNQFKRLGIFSDYNKRYLTLDPNFEASQLRLFTKMVEKNLIYRDLRPIYWSPSSESALAEAEIEYADIKSPSVFVSVKVIDDKEFKNSYFIIWTTTPWTIPSNQLIAIGKDITYVLIKSSNFNKEFIIAKDLLTNIVEQIGFEDVKILKEFKSSQLLNLQYQHPWYDAKIGKVVFGNHVTTEAGTGLVHIAGGFGVEDFIITTQNNIKAFVPINDQGIFDETINDKRIEGLFYEDANKVIGTELEKKGLLLKLKFIKHSYPHDWRTKKPVIYRATHQWFVSLRSIKSKIDAVILKNITTNPIWSKERLRNIIKDRDDWTISRQRLWGVPIIAFYDEKKQPVYNSEIINFAINVIIKKGTNAWFELAADNFLPKEHQNKGWTKEKDILDVWFDSGTSNIALQENFNFKRPYDVYLEGNDQYRGWFNSSMINSVIYDDLPAYKQLLTHGMTNDEQGKKMSKSNGNVTDPLKITNDLGADILRLWVCSTDFTNDQRIGEDILKQISESYRKIRNTIRFILSNLEDFDPNVNYQKELAEVDIFALHSLSVVKDKFIKNFDDYNFNAAFKIINNFVINDLSSFYLDFIKDIIYIEKQNSTRRRQVQTVIYEQLWLLIDMLRPILPHTIEEVYKSIKHIKQEESVHLLNIKEQYFLQDDKFIEKWKIVLLLKNEVNEALEKARNEKIIKKSFEAKIFLTLKPEYEFLKQINDLAQIFMVNYIIFNQLNSKITNKIADIKVEARSGLKCQRCWVIFDELVDLICQRCFDVIN